MDVREWLNKHPRVAASLVSGFVLIGTGMVVAEVVGNRRPPIGQPAQHYFSVDDGKTYFAAEGSNIPPFEYKGQVAVRAHVFQSGSTTFVGYLERYTPSARKAEIAHTISPFQEVDGREVKKPGDAGWISTANHRDAGKLMNVVSPDGTKDRPTPLEP